MTFMRSVVAFVLLLATLVSGGVAAQNCHLRSDAVLVKPGVAAVQQETAQSSALAKVAASQSLSVPSAALQGNCCKGMAMAACCAIGVLPDALFAPFSLPVSALSYIWLEQHRQSYAPGTDLRPPILA